MKEFKIFYNLLLKEFENNKLLQNKGFCVNYDWVNTWRDNTIYTKAILNCDFKNFIKKMPYPNNEELIKYFEALIFYKYFWDNLQNEYISKLFIAKLTNTDMIKINRYDFMIQFNKIIVKIVYLGKMNIKQFKKNPNLNNLNFDNINYKCIIGFTTNSQSINSCIKDIVVNSDIINLILNIINKFNKFNYIKIITYDYKKFIIDNINKSIIIYENGIIDKIYNVKNNMNYEINRIINSLEYEKIHNIEIHNTLPLKNIMKILKYINDNDI